MAIAVFNQATFLARYPEFTAFATANPAALPAMFTEAGDYLNNTDCSPVQDIARRTRLLNMLTAHIAFLGGALSADGQTRPVGRMDSATEGSVSASFDYTAATPGSGAWFNQSQYGAAFWQATSSLRGMHYRPRPTRVEGPFPFRFNPFGRGF